MQTQIEVKTMITSLLNEMGVEYEEEELPLRIKISGIVNYASISENGVSEISIITDNGIRVAFSYYLEVNTLFVENEERARQLLLSKNINTVYRFPYLEIIL